jgi:hypothetical protein
MGRRDDDAVGQPPPTAAIVRQDGVRDDGRGCRGVLRIHDDVDLVRRQHLHDRAERRFGQRVRVTPEV